MAQTKGQAARGTEAAPNARSDVRASSGRKVVHLTPGERAARGKAARAEVPRSSHAAWDPPAHRPDPVELLEEQSADRVPELVPIRYGRMLVSPFTFYRGGAYLMASDLAATPNTGLRVQLCGDAHLSNFGGFGSPERKLVFDINDFDETTPGPWEWDVKRLAASFSVAGRDRSFAPKQRRSIVQGTVRQYRLEMRELAAASNLDVWYARLDETDLIAHWQQEASRKQIEVLERSAAKARTKDSMRAFAKLTHEVDGEPRIISDPPLIVPIEELLPEVERARLEDALTAVLRSYRRSLQGDRKHLLEEFRMVHVARKVVGVGSVGTRAWIVLLLGRDEGDPLFLQFKEAQDSVLARFVGRGSYSNQGQRVVEGQRLMQAASDIFLGWDRIQGMDDKARDFYVRQLWDWKASADIDGMSSSTMGFYGQACAWALARAHARSGDRIAIAEYLGKGDAFDLAIAEFAESYAEQNERDYAAFAEAVKSKRLVAETGL
jgi:uncharacterized protein (DUF2252 family)